MGTILNSSLYLIFNALNFWLVQGNEIAELIQTFREFAKYPINIFPAVFSSAFYRSDTVRLYWILSGNVFTWENKDVCTDVAFGSDIALCAGSSAHLVLWNEKI